MLEHLLEHLNRTNLIYEFTANAKLLECLEGFAKVLYKIIYTIYLYTPSCHIHDVILFHGIMVQFLNNGISCAHVSLSASDVLYCAGYRIYCLSFLGYSVVNFIVL